MAELVRTVGRYGIIREVGRGGMAVVHLARQLDLDRLVALKELASFHASDPDFARRFVRESRLAGSLMHPNIVTVFDFFEDDGTPYIAMEYLDHGSLRPHVGKLTPEQIGGVMEGLLAGLAAAEHQGIVHRDLKPENLMVTSEGGIKIADFGIAKATQATQTGAFVTATGSTVGTPPYMAPEQAMAKEVGPWTDIYSVGCIAYELYTGRPPFYDTDNPMAILLRHINEPLPSASEMADVDPEVSAWIAQLTAKDPSKRPPTATDAWEDYEEILIGMLGPRWRRGARLAEVPPQVAGPATPPPPYTPGPVPGIDEEGTGPDTGGAMPAAGESAFETYVPRSTIRPPAAASGQPPAPPPPPSAPPQAAEPTPPPRPAAAPQQSARPAAAPQQPAREPAPPGAVPDHAVLLARAGAVGFAAAVLMAIFATDADRWNLFAVLSPFEAAGIAAAAWLLAGALRDGRATVPFAAGVLLGLGALGSVAALGLIKFALERLGALPTVLALVLLLAAPALVMAGLACLRASPALPAAAPDPMALLAGFGGAALIGVALFVHYDGFSSLWSEVPEGFSAEFFFEPAAAAILVLVALFGVLTTRPQVAAGLLLAVGGASALHFLGLIVAAWRAIGEVGDVGSAGFIGLLGGLLVLAAGWAARRS